MPVLGQEVQAPEPVAGGADVPPGPSLEERMDRSLVEVGLTDVAQRLILDGVGLPLQ